MHTIVALMLSHNAAQTLRAVVLLLACAPHVGARPLSAPTAEEGPPAVSAADRSAIEHLLAAYNDALSTCAAAAYADLFTPDGAFTSDDFRGARHRALYGKSATLVGRDKLVQLVDTEDFCLDPVQRARRAAAPRNVGGSLAGLTLAVTVDGIRGTLPLGNGGRYEDVYVRTAGGWKFKARRVVMPTAP
jgi:hypothetical protein